MSKYAPKIGIEEMFQEAQSKGNMLSIFKVGEGSILSKSVPAIKNKIKENVKLTVAASLVIAAVSWQVFAPVNLSNGIVEKTTNYFKNSTESASQAVNKIENSSSSVIDRIKNNVSNFGEVVKNSEENQKEKLEKIHAENVKNGYATENSHKSGKILGELKGIRAITGDSNNVFLASKFVNSKNFNHLNAIGKFEMQPGLANNQIANLISRHSFRNGNYYESLMVAGEGYTKTTADNIGSTIYHGINTKFQSKETLKHLARGITQNDKIIAAYESVAGATTTGEINKKLADAWVSPARSLQMTTMLQETYDKGIFPYLANKGKSGEQVLDSLEPNVQAAVRYMPFKVGSGGFGNYKTLIGLVKTYANTPMEQRTQEMRDKMADGISFKYTVTVTKDGKTEKIIKTDTRAEMLVKSMIKSPEAFAYMLGEDVKPQYFDAMYKKVTGDNEAKSFDKNNFEYPATLSGPQEEMEKLKAQGYEVKFDQKDYFAQEQSAKMELKVKNFNDGIQGVEKETVKKKYCISGTTITCR